MDTTRVSCLILARWSCKLRKLRKLTPDRIYTLPAIVVEGLGDYINPGAPEVHRLSAVGDEWVPGASKNLTPLLGQPNLQRQE